jgi:glycosyltransferase involved in cell wall biosynthesis
MKILILIQCTNLGGMEHNMLLLLDELKTLNIDSEVVSIVPVGDLGKKLEARNIPVCGGSYRGPGGFLSLAELHGILKSRQADALLMIGHNLMGEIAIGNLWRGRRALALHYHHTGVKSRFVWNLIYGIACLQFRRIGFVSDYIMKEAISVAPFLKGKAGMISTPVESHDPFPSEARDAARKTLGIQEGEFVIGNAGWLIRRKRWDVFLDTSAEVAKKHGRIRLLVAGDGPERASLEARAKELGIFEKIIWMGWQSDLTKFLQSIDLMLFNSDWDAQPRTPLEAMSYAVPVVASIASGGTREVIADDSVGILIDRHDTGVLASSILKLIHDPKLRRSLGNAGLHRIRDFGSPRNHALMTLEALGFRASDTNLNRWERI